MYALPTTPFRPNGVPHLSGGGGGGGGGADFSSGVGSAFQQSRPHPYPELGVPPLSSLRERDWAMYPTVTMGQRPDPRTAVSHAAYANEALKSFSSSTDSDISPMPPVDPRKRQRVEAPAMRAQMLPPRSAFQDIPTTPRPYFHTLLRGLGVSASEAEYLLTTGKPIPSGPISTELASASARSAIIASALEAKNFVDEASSALAVEQAELRKCRLFLETLTSAIMSSRGYRGGAGGF